MIESDQIGSKSGVLVNRATVSASTTLSPSPFLSNLTFSTTLGSEPRTSNFELRTSNSDLDREDSAAKKQTGDPRKRLEESVSPPPLAFLFSPASSFLRPCVVRTHHGDRSSDSYASLRKLILTSSSLVVRGTI